MKNGIAGLLKFAGGAAFGATLGAAIGVLMAPRSGEETRAETVSFLATVKSEGNRAREEAEAKATERFRQAVDDPSALASQA